jgi:hypothetical protein
MKQVLAVCVSLLTLAVAPAQAVEVSVDGITAVLELPKAYCALSRKHLVERAFYDQQDRLQAGINKVVMIAAPCSGIKALRTKGAAPRYAIWMMPAGEGHPRRVPDGIARQDVLDALARAIPKLDTGALMNKLDDRIAAEGIALEVDSSGLIAQDPNAIYMGMAGKVANASSEIRFAGVTGMTVMSRRMFSLNLYDTLENRATFDRMLAAAKDTLARSVAASAKIKVPDVALPPGMMPVKPAPGAPRKPDGDKPHQNA